MDSVPNHLALLLVTSLSSHALKKFLFIVFCLSFFLFLPPALSFVLFGVFSPGILPSLPLVTRAHRTSWRFTTTWSQRTVSWTLPEMFWTFICEFLFFLHTFVLSVVCFWILPPWWYQSRSGESSIQPRQAQLNPEKMAFCLCSNQYRYRIFPYFNILFILHASIMIYNRSSTEMYEKMYYGVNFAGLTCYFKVGEHIDLHI